jgi:ankyrin repeat protein
MKAAEGGHYETCRMLLDAGAAVDVKNERGETPLMLAERKDVRELLLNSRELRHK